MKSHHPLPTRRAMIVGAAWSVPVVSLAVAIPAVALSTTRTITFARSSYSITGCSILATASVTVRDATTNAVVAGVPVTFTLTGDAQPRFVKDSQTTSIVVSGSNGVAVVSNLRATYNLTGSGTITATAAGAASTTIPLNTVNNPLQGTNC